MGHLTRLFWMARLLLGAARPTAALTVDYSASPLGGNLWRNDHHLTNDSLSPINEITICFDQASFASLAILDSPLGWDIRASQAAGHRAHQGRPSSPRMQVAVSSQPGGARDRLASIANCRWRPTRQGHTTR